ASSSRASGGRTNRQQLGAVVQVSAKKRTPRVQLATFTRPARRSGRRSCMRSNPAARARRATLPADSGRRQNPDTNANRPAPTYVLAPIPGRMLAFPPFQGDRSMFSFHPRTGRAFGRVFAGALLGSLLVLSSGCGQDAKPAATPPANAPAKTAAAP